MFLLSISFLIISFNIKASEDFKCFDQGKIRFIKNSRLLINPKSYCINHSELDLISLDCIEKNRKCRAVTSYNQASILTKNYGTIGSPYHRKCYLLGGKAQFIEYWDDKSWNKASVCKFDDGSFISIFNSL